MNFILYFLLVNSPYFFSICWNVIKPLLDEKTTKKITIVGKNYYNSLLEFVDEENIPRGLGGKCKC